MSFPVLRLAAIGLLTCCTTLAVAQTKLNLTVPKAPVNDTTPAPSSTKDLNNTGNAPAGYQENDMCSNGIRSSDVRIINGKTYYKCAPMGTRSEKDFPPRVRDGEIDSRQAPCPPHSQDPRCRSTGNSVTFTTGEGEPINLSMPKR